MAGGPGSWIIGSAVTSILSAVNQLLSAKVSTVMNGPLQKKSMIISECQKKIMHASDPGNLNHYN